VSREHATRLALIERIPREPAPTAPDMPLADFEAHGGRISATANSPHGAVFAARLPLASEGTAVS
jgi:hypothetical protein